MILKTLLSIFVGSILAILYGLSILVQKKKVISIFEVNSEKKGQIKIMLFSFIRLIILFIILYCLSGLQNINFILTISFFIIVLWIMMLHNFKNS